MEQVLEAELATIANKANELAGLRARERQSQNNLAALGARIAAMQAEDDADSADMARLRNSIRFNEADRREKSTGFERLQRCHDVGVGAEAAQQAFLEYTAEHYLASANLEAKLHGLSNRMQDLQDGLNARCEQIKALEQLQESMKVNLKSHMADCTRTANELSLLRPQSQVDDDLRQKQLQLQRLLDAGEALLLLDRAGLEIILRDIDDLIRVGLKATVDTVFDTLGVQDRHITFDQFEAWYRDAVHQQIRTAHYAASDRHDDAVCQRNKTLAELEHAAEQINEDITDLKRLTQGTVLDLDYASARISVPMLLSNSQLTQLASWIRTTCLPLLVRAIEQSRPELRKEAALVVSKLAVALGASSDWHWSLDFLLPPLIGSADSEVALRAPNVFRALSNSSLPAASSCFSHLVMQCAECLTGCGRWRRTLKGSHGTLAVLMLLHRLLHQALCGELGAGGVTALLKHCKRLVSAMTAAMDTTADDQDRHIKKYAEQALEYLCRLDTSRNISSASADSDVSTRSMQLQFHEFEKTLRQRRRCAESQTGNLSQEQPPHHAGSRSIRRAPATGCGDVGNNAATRRCGTGYNEPRQEELSEPQLQIQQIHEQLGRSDTSVPSSGAQHGARERVLDEQYTQQQRLLSRDQQQYLEHVARQSSERKKNQDATALISASIASDDAVVHDWDSEISRPVLGTADGAVLDFDAKVPEWGKLPSSHKSQRQSSARDAVLIPALGVYEQERRRLGFSAETPRHQHN